MCLQGEADANKVSEQVTLGYTQATTATTGGQLLAKSGLSLAAYDWKWPLVSVTGKWIDKERIERLRHQAEHNSVSVWPRQLLHAEAPGFPRPH
jgi:hypothetical protein